MVLRYFLVKERGDSGKAEELLAHSCPGSIVDLWANGFQEAIA